MVTISKGPALIKDIRMKSIKYALSVIVNGWGELIRKGIQT